MDKIKTQINAALKSIGDEIQRLHDAENHLKAALKFVEGNKGNVAYPPSLTPIFSISSQESVSLLVDKYLDSLNSGAEFTVGDAVSAVCSGGYEPTNDLRRHVSSVLSRRVKRGVIKRLGLRGSFVKTPMSKENQGAAPVVQVVRHDETPAGLRVHGGRLLQE